VGRELRGIEDKKVIPAAARPASVYRLLEVRLICLQAAWTSNFNLWQNHAIAIDRAYILLQGNIKENSPTLNMYDVTFKYSINTELFPLPMAKDCWKNTFNIRVI
jgi:hypothetical protein